MCPAASPAVYEATEDKADNLLKENGEPVEQAENEPKVIHVHGPMTTSVVKLYQGLNPNRQIHLVPDPDEYAKEDPDWPKIA